jgi:hypothetical protein
MWVDFPNDLNYPDASSKTNVIDPGPEYQVFAARGM